MQSGRPKNRMWLVTGVTLLGVGDGGGTTIIFLILEQTISKFSFNHTRILVDSGTKIVERD